MLKWAMKAGVIRSQINQAQALEELGFNRRALDTLTQVNETLQGQPDSLLKVNGLRSLGNVLQEIGDLDQSRQVLEQSLAIAKASQSSPDISAALFSLGNLARSQQDTKAALDFYQQAEGASASPTTRVEAQLNQLSLLLEQIKSQPPRHCRLRSRLSLLTYQLIEQQSMPESTMPRV
jgi:tetratricopeptide (TPR) repeat protein